MEIKISKDKSDRLTKKKTDGSMNILYKIILLVIIFLVWHFAAKDIGSSLLLPMPVDVIKGFFFCVTDAETVTNLFITLQRVLKGFMYALLFGLPIGFIMGFSKTFERVLSPVVDSVRQVPIMAWVPLTIVWFGIGDGPTIFLIAFLGVFPIILNTIQGVRAISKDYYNAARSMGASPIVIFTNVIVPASLPDILTGSRTAISTGWMSVI